VIGRIADKVYAIERHAEATATPGLPPRSLELKALADQFKLKALRKP
jgi:hypothetical protein